MSDAHGAAEGGARPTAPTSSVPPAKRLRVAVVDDHALMRAGLVSLIQAQNDMTVAFEASGPEGVLVQVAQHQPDVLTTDLTMHGADGIDLVRRIKRAHPTLPVLVLSMLDESIYAERTLQWGADGYIMKNMGGEQLLQALRTIASGRKFLSESVWAQLIGTLKRRPSKQGGTPVGKLTAREFQILELIGRGRNTREIAALLGISPKTVDVHRGRLRAKLDLRDTAALLRCATSQGSVPGPADADAPR